MLERLFVHVDYYQCQKIAKIGIKEVNSVHAKPVIFIGKLMKVFLHFKGWSVCNLLFCGETISWLFLSSAYQNV